MVVASGLTMYVLLHGWPGAGHGDGAAMPRGVYGKPEPGKALAVVHTAGKTINFSGVECRRLGSGVDVSYGKSIDDTTYFHAVVIFGPPNEQSQYVLAYVPLLIGHRPGVRFDLRSKSAPTVLSSELARGVPGITAISAEPLSLTRKTQEADIVAARSELLPGSEGWRLAAGPVPGDEGKPRHLACLLRDRCRV
jgi:hypothetical protein